MVAGGKTKKQRHGRQRSTHHTQAQRHRGVIKTVHSDESGIFIVMFISLSMCVSLRESETMTRHQQCLTFLQLKCDPTLCWRCVSRAPCSSIHRASEGCTGLRAPPRFSELIGGIKLKCYSVKTERFLKTCVYLTVTHGEAVKMHHNCPTLIALANLQIPEY